MTAATRLLDERLASAIGLEERDTTRPRVDKRCLERCAKIVLGRHVHHGIVEEDDVESAAEAQRSHVSRDVLALRIQAPREREHLLRDVRQGAREARFQVTRVVAATGSELEQRSELAIARRLGEPNDLGGLLRIVPRRGEEVKPVRKVGVETHHRRDVSR